jgi:hypothetical protein
MLSVVMLRVIMLSVIMLSVIMISVIMLSVILLSAIMLSVNMLNVVAPQQPPKLEKKVECIFDKIKNSKFYLIKLATNF